MTTQEIIETADTGAMAEIEKKAPQVVERGGIKVVLVCSWCYPGLALIEAFPEFAGLQRSDGVCAAHALIEWENYLASKSN